MCNDPLQELHELAEEATINQERVQRATVDTAPFTNKTVLERKETHSWSDGTMRESLELPLKQARCLCFLSGPGDVGGLCQRCGNSLLSKIFKRPPVVCKQHRYCNRCQRRIERLEQGRTLPQRLMRVIEWFCCLDRK